MKYRIRNPLIGTFEYFETQAEALAKAAEYKEAYLQQESTRFTAVKEAVYGDDVTWIPTDLDTEADANGNYQVFNTLTGTHERTESLTNARQKMAEIKEQFAIAYRLNECVLADEEADKNVSFDGVKNDTK